MARTKISSIYLSVLLAFSERLEDERGANLIEYSLLVVFIAVVAFIAVGIVGRETASNISDVVSGL